MKVPGRKKVLSTARAFMAELSAFEVLAIVTEACVNLTDSSFCFRLTLLSICDTIENSCSSVRVGLANTSDTYNVHEISGHLLMVRSQFCRRFRVDSHSGKLCHEVALTFIRRLDVVAACFHGVDGNLELFQTHCNERQSVNNPAQGPRGRFIVCVLVRRGLSGAPIGLVPGQCLHFKQIFAVLSELSSISDKDSFNRFQR